MFTVLLLAPWRVAARRRRRARRRPGRRRSSSGRSSSGRVVDGRRRRSSGVAVRPGRTRPARGPAPSSAHGTAAASAARFFAPGLPCASTASVDAGVVDGGDPPGDLSAEPAGPDGDGDQPADVAPPVPRLGERPVDAGAGHLEHVGRAAHAVVVGVEHLGDRAADLGDVVEGHALVAVDDDADDAAPAGRGDDELLQVVPGGGDDGLDPAGQPGGGRVGAAGCRESGHGFLLRLGRPHGAERGPRPGAPGGCRRRCGPRSRRRKGQATARDAGPTGPPRPRGGPGRRCRAATRTRCRRCRPGRPRLRGWARCPLLPASARRGFSRRTLLAASAAGLALLSRPGARPLRRTSASR